MTHKNKKKLARRMLTQIEIKQHIPIFQSKQWEQRKLAKQLKQRKQGDKKTLKTKTN